MQDEKIPKRKKSPNLATYSKIQELAAYREQYIQEKGKPPTLINACQSMAINHRTVKRHAPQLIERWQEKDFRW